MFTTKVMSSCVRVSRLEGRGAYETTKAHATMDTSSERYQTRVQLHEAAAPVVCFEPIGMLGFCGQGPDAEHDHLAKGDMGGGEGEGEGRGDGQGGSRGDGQGGSRGDGHGGSRGDGQGGPHRRGPQLKQGLQKTQELKQRKSKRGPHRRGLLRRLLRRPRPRRGCRRRRRAHPRDTRRGDRGACGGGGARVGREATRRRRRRRRGGGRGGREARAQHRWRGGRGQCGEEMQQAANARASADAAAARAAAEAQMQ